MEMHTDGLTGPISLLLPSSPVLPCRLVTISGANNQVKEKCLGKNKSYSLVEESDRLVSEWIEFDWFMKTLMSFGLEACPLPSLAFSNLKGRNWLPGKFIVPKKQKFIKKIYSINIGPTHYETKITKLQRCN